MLRRVASATEFTRRRGAAMAGLSCLHVGRIRRHRSTIERDDVGEAGMAMRNLRVRHPEKFEPHEPHQRCTFPHRVVQSCRETPAEHVSSLEGRWPLGGSAAQWAETLSVGQHVLSKVTGTATGPRSTAAADEEERIVMLARKAFGPAAVGGSTSACPSGSASGLVGYIRSILRRKPASAVGPRRSIQERAQASECGPAAEAQQQPQVDDTTSAGLAVKKGDEDLRQEDLAMTQLVANLSPERRRYLIVTAAAEEWYGANAVRAELRHADSDSDANISEADYRAWVKTVFDDRGGLSRREFFLVACHTAIPFVAFGFLDNSILVLSGDAIDRVVGATLGLSAMAAAGLGGICSGTIGIQVHGLAERAVQALGLQPPPLTATQRQHASFSRATHIGGTVGICVGLTVGMLPLLFLPEPAPHDAANTVAEELAAEA